jgi:hypothetical protein
VDSLLPQLLTTNAVCRQPLQILDKLADATWIGCDTVMAKNGTSVNGTQPNGWGIQDPDNTNCQSACVGNTGQTCGQNSGTMVRLSVYEFVVSGFHNNACVLKLKQNFLFFLCNLGSMRTNVTRSAMMNGGLEDGEGDGYGKGGGEGNGDGEMEGEGWGYVKTVGVAEVVSGNITGIVVRAYHWSRRGDGTGQLVFCCGSVYGRSLLVNNQYYSPCFSLLVSYRLGKGPAHNHSHKTQCHTNARDCLSNDKVLTQLRIGTILCTIAQFCDRRLVVEEMACKAPRRQSTLEQLVLSQPSPDWTHCCTPPLHVVDEAHQTFGNHHTKTPSKELTALDSD